jgi:hypothetical protein
MYQIELQYIAHLHKSTIDGHKNNSTMVSNASPGIPAPKMNEFCVHMAHVSSDCACTQDSYLKRPHPTIIDGDMRWDSGWFWGGHGVGGHRTSAIAKQKLGKKTHPNHGSCHCPMAAMVPSPRHRCIQQLASMLRNRSMLLKLENINVFTIFSLAI